MFNTKKKQLKKLMKRIENSNMFDKTFYLREYPDLRLADYTPLEHYCKYGIKEDRKPNNWFDPIWYKTYYKDVQQDSIDAFSHYVLFGKKENRMTSEIQYNELKKDLYKYIDETNYLAANQDIKENSLEHFITFGFDEINSGKRRLGLEFPYFIEKEYIQKNPDVAGALSSGALHSAIEHFIRHGKDEYLSLKREIGGYYPFYLDETLFVKLKNKFDEKSYLEANPDVKNAILEKKVKSGFEHFIKYGIDEIRFGQRKIHPDLPFFNESAYVLNNNDILNAMRNSQIISPYKHFLLFGINEILNGTRSIGNKNKYSYVTPILNKEITNEIDSFIKKPLISVVMPVYNVDPKWIDLAIKSLEDQWYTNWELCIADDKSTKEETVNYLKSINSEKIKIKFLEKNLNISGASNEALSLATGEYIAMMDNDDELTPDALYEVVRAINTHDAEFIYSDEDKLEMDGTYSDPHFKANYAPNMLLSQNYISHLCVIKKELIDEVGGWEIGLEGSQDFDLYLKVLEKTDKIIHIPKVLYHWRKIPGSTAAEFSDKSYAQEAGKKAIENAMKRRNIKTTISSGRATGTYKINYDIEDNPLVSIIIPFKDKPELLKMCIESILRKSTYKNFEIIGISNNSEEKEIFDEMTRLKNLDSRINFYEYNVPFNYSQINNYAVEKFVKGEHIILLNNDIEIITPNWIEEMLMFSQQRHIGAVGAKLYYPDNTIQHAGVIVGLGGVAGHSHKYFSKNDPGYFNRLNIVQELSAVTAACLMIKKSIFDEVNGLNENDLKIAFNDVDFCLRVQEKGYKNIFTPYSEAYHHESISRGAEDNPEKIKRFNTEVDYMKKRHELILKDGDPFYNVNLTLSYENFELR